MDAIYRKHHPGGLITSYIHPKARCHGKSVIEKASNDIDFRLQGSPDFIGPRNQLHQALFDLSQHYKNKRG